MTAIRPCRVLIVEDEYLLADDLDRLLDRAGATVVGPAATEADALALLAEESVDCAVLDINLRGEMVYPLATALRARKVPFLFVSGYEEAAPEAGFDDVELITKPFEPDAVVRGIERLIRQDADRPA